MRNAFSLMELMIVIIILGLLSSLVLPNLIGKGEEAKQKIVCVQMKSMSESLKMFKIDNGRYPSTDEGLAALVSNPDSDELTNYASSAYIDGNLPKDPWNNDYIYTNNEGEIDLISLGANKEEGGNKEDKDIYFSQCSK